MSCLTFRRDTAGIILAAGASIRLGRPKQLVLLNGRPLLERVINAALESKLDHIVLVLGYHAAEIKRALGSILELHPQRPTRPVVDASRPPRRG